MKLTLDLTPWVRGPRSSIGLTAFRSAQAVSELIRSQDGIELSFVSRDLKFQMRRQAARFLKDPIQWLSPWRRTMGWEREIFHSFELRLPPLRQSRKILTVNDVWTLDDNNQWQSKEFQKRRKKIFVHALKSSERIITPSEWVRLQLGKWDPKLLQRTSVVPWGPLWDEKTPILEAAVQSKGAGRGSLLNVADPVRNYLFEKRPFVLMVANFETRKNHRLLFEALHGVKDLDLVLVGFDGHGFEDVRAAIENVKTQVRVCVFEGLDELSLLALYDATRGLVSTSFDEGFGLPLVEAMNRGRPMVVSKIPVHEEVAGSAALYFDAVNGVDELREHLIALRDDAYVQKELSERSKLRSGHFGWDLTARKLVDVYRSL